VPLAIDKLTGKVYLFDFPTTSGTTSGGTYQQVNTYNDLPTPGLHVGKIFVVLVSTGSFLLNRKEAGLYISNGVSWKRLGDIPSFFNDNNFRLFNDNDNTKQIKFQLSGNTTNVTHNIVIRNDNDETIAYLSDLDLFKDEINAYTGATDIIINDIYDNINYISGVTETKLNITLFNSYTASTENILDDLNQDITYLSGQTDNKLNKNIFNLYTGTTASSTYVLKTTFSNFTGNTAIQSANNGLNKIGTNVRLGGTLSGNTLITTASGSKLEIAGFPINYTTDLSANFTSKSLVDKNYVTGITTTLTTTANNGITKSGQNFRLGGSLTGSTTLTTSSLNTLSISGYPILYGSDLSSSFSNRSLVDKGYVTGITNTLTVTANNGITKSGQNFRLGGTLTGNTTILNNNSDFNINYVDYIPSSTQPTFKEGRVFYETTTHTFCYYDQFSGTTVNIGYESLIRVRNNTGSQINNGQAVYISGAIGQTVTIALAQANDESIIEKTIGLATHDIPNNSFGKVCVFGLVNDINTSSYNEGDRLYVSATVAGGLTSTPPVSPNAVKRIGIVQYSHIVNGKILVSPGSSLDNDNNLGTNQEIGATQNAVKSYVDNSIGVVYSNETGAVKSVESNIDIVGTGQIIVTNGSSVLSGISTTFTDSTSGIGVGYWFQVWFRDSANTLFRIVLASITNNTTATISAVYNTNDIRNGQQSNQGANYNGVSGTYSYYVVRNVAEDLFSLAFGNNTYARNFGLAIGGSVSATGQTSFASGRFTLAGGDQSFTQGNLTKASGNRSFAGGFGNITGGDKRVLASGLQAFNFSENNSSQTVGHGALAQDSAILGGLNHNIPSNSLRCAIIGGNLIKAVAAVNDTVYLPLVRIGQGTGGALTSGSTSNDLLVRNIGGIIQTRTVTSVLANLTANNGIVRSVNNFRLGGSLTGSTTIDATTFGFIQTGTTGQFNVGRTTGSINLQSRNSVTLKGFSTAGIERTTLKISATGTTFTDSRTGTTAVGMQYTSNYGSNFGVRSIVDKGWVTGYTQLYKYNSGSAPTLVTATKTFVGQATTNSSGVATFNITQNGTATGTSIFSTIYNVQVTAENNTSSLTDVPLASYKTTTTLQVLTVNVVNSGTSTAEGLEFVGAGINVHVLIFGI